VYKALFVLGTYKNMLGIYSTEKTRSPGGLNSVQPSHEIKKIITSIFPLLGF